MSVTEETELKKLAKIKGLVRISESFNNLNTGPYGQQRWIGPSESIDWLSSIWDLIGQERKGCIEWSIDETQNESYIKFLQGIWLSSIEKGIVYRN
jgi:hypothetical protein